MRWVVAVGIVVFSTQMGMEWDPFIACAFGFVALVFDLVDGYARSEK